MMSLAPLVKVERVSFHYDPDIPSCEWALREVTLHVYAGEAIAVIGPNGSGKSSLAKLLNGLLVPLSGQIRVDGLNPADEQEVWAVRERVGIVLQNPDNQIVAPVVEDDVAFGLENIGLPRPLIRQRVADAIERVGLSGLEQLAPSRLSGGQKQRLAIAGILAMRPDFMILDEATAMLDPAGREDVLNTIETVKEQGIAIMMITHSLEEALRADRVVVMADGRIQLVGSPEYVFQCGDFLSELGLDVPFTVRLADELRQRGINPLSVDTIDQRNLVNTLWTLWQND